jgi:3-oxoacyl-[acyl-carrier-protein] synthase II
MGEGDKSPTDLSFVLPHGSGTKKGDRAEMRALKEFLSGSEVPLAAWKPHTGHMGSASDVGEMILGLKALREGALPPTLGFETAEKEFDNLDIAAEERVIEGDSFLSLSHGLGGQSSATLLSAP